MEWICPQLTLFCAPRGRWDESRQMMRSLAFAGLILLAAESAAPGADLAPAQKAAICGTRASCRIVAMSDAGNGVGGVNLAVAEARFALADKPESAPDDGCRSDEGDNDGGHEFWLLQGADTPKLLLALCNDGYGAADVGDDKVTVTPNGLVYEQDGGSNWRWNVTKKIRLSPLAVTHELSCSYNIIGPLTGQVTDIDRLALHARSVGYTADAKQTDDIGDCPDWPTGPDSVLPTGPTLAGGYAIPAPMGNATTPLPGGSALADCALDLSTDGLHGFLVYGQAATPDSAATLRAIQETSTSLLLQIRDPMAAAELSAGKAKSWVQQPHVEVWTSQEGEAGENGAPNIVYQQFAVGLDGRTFPGAGDPASLPEVAHWAAKDETGRDVTVLRLSWDEQSDAPLGGVGVVYSQAADGKQARLVSNALIKKNQPLYLPPVWWNEPEDNGIPGGRCALDDSKLLRLAGAP